MAADARTGKTLWEQATPTSFRSDAPEQGNGPYAAPLIAGDRVFTAGVAGRLQCLDKKSGKPLWTQELWREHGGTPLRWPQERDVGPGREDPPAGPRRWRRTGFPGALATALRVPQGPPRDGSGGRDKGGL